MNEPVTGVPRIHCDVFHLEKERSKMPLTLVQGPKLEAFFLTQPPQVLHTREVSYVHPSPVLPRPTTEIAQSEYVSMGPDFFFFNL